jgi:hypothetical protein
MIRRERIGLEKRLPDLNRWLRRRFFTLRLGRLYLSVGTERRVLG